MSAMTAYNTEWMKLGQSPVEVLGLPNRQSKVPMGQSTARQTHPESAPNDQAQDEPGMGSVGTAGIGEASQGKSYIEDCSLAAQAAGSKAGAFPAPLTPLNKGDGGSASVDFSAPEIRSTKAQGQQPTPGRGDIGVAPGMLFPGIVE